MVQQDSINWSTKILYCLWYTSQPSIYGANTELVLFRMALGHSGE
jgi:hypothetical protein